MNSFLISTSFGLPVVQTKAAADSSSQSKAATEETLKKVKVSSLPLYPEPEK
jgi:hypothetical protein